MRHHYLCAPVIPAYVLVCVVFARKTAQQLGGCGLAKQELWWGGRLRIPGPRRCLLEEDVESRKSAPVLCVINLYCNPHHNMKFLNRVDLHLL